MQANPERPPQRRPATRVACSFCHTRRIRCDAYQSQPCSNCISAETTCQLIDSRRGRYARTKSKRATRPSPSAETAEQRMQRSSSRGAMTSILQSAPQLAFISENVPVDLTKGLDGGTSVTERVDLIPDLESRAAQSKPKLLIKDKEGSENLYARLSELELSTPETRNLPGIRTVYLGESWLLTYVVQEAISPERSSDCSSPASLQVLLPSSISDKPKNLGYDSRLSPQDIEVLNLRGAFTLPEKAVSDQLVQTFFEDVHPAFPIFDRKEFSHLYEQNELSLLILQSVYVIASTLCDEDVIKQTGFKDRDEARKAFLHRAKALYDVDYETNKVSLVQAIFLLSFLWTGSMDDKDMWHWLGIAISTAQAKGMHRSTVNSNLRLQDRRLWKRLWWLLYIRDRHCAANIGRPMRICDDDCDVEPLEESDFEDFVVNGSTIYGITNKTHALYVISMSKLSTIFSNIVVSKFPITKERKTWTREQLSNQLSTWREQLPSELRDADEVGDNGFWARMLELNYNHHRILLHRPEHGSALGNDPSSQTIAFAAANKITRVVDDFLAMKILRRAQLQICPSIFVALTMYTIMARKSDPMERALSKHKAKLLLLGCTEISKTWPACGWIQRLFETVFENIEQKSSQLALESTSQQVSTYTDPEARDQALNRTTEDVERSNDQPRQHDSGQPATSLGDDDATATFQPIEYSHSSLLNIPDVFNPEFLNGLSQDFMMGDPEFFPYTLDFGFQEN